MTLTRRFPLASSLKAAGFKPLASLDLPTYPFAVDCRGTASWCELDTFKSQAAAEAFIGEERTEDERTQTITRWEYRVRDKRVVEAPQESV